MGFHSFIFLFNPGHKLIYIFHLIKTFAIKIKALAISFKKIYDNKCKIFTVITKIKLQWIYLYIIIT